MPHLAKVGYGAHRRHLGMSRVGAPSSARAFVELVAIYIDQIGSQGKALISASTWQRSTVSLSIRRYGRWSAVGVRSSLSTGF